jgi:hypothetical protein
VEETGTATGGANTPVALRTGSRTGAESDCDDGCDLVTVPARQGLEAVDILRRLAGDTVGPVLHADGTLGFVVPRGTAACWDVPGSTCTGTEGAGLRLPLSVYGPGPGYDPGDTDWLLPPDGVDLATDPTALRAALGEAARLIEAADNCS